MAAICVLLIFANDISDSQGASSAGLKISIIPGPQCYDGQDNDGDGKTDYPADPQCDSSNDNSEAPIIVPPPGGGGGGSGGIDITPSTSVIIAGYAYPDNQVTLLKDGQIAQAVKADSNANFKFQLSGISQGEYLFTIYSEDSYHLKSDNFSFSLQVMKGAMTNIGGVFIAPSLKLSDVSFRHGDDLAIMGQSVPGAQINTVINSKIEHNLAAVADKNGFYMLHFDTGLLEIGDHSAKAKSKYKQQESSFSRITNFEVVGKDEAIGEPELEDKPIGDINGDGRINLIDFSIMAFWYKKKNPPANVDLNGDKTVNLIDFSILAYHWTG